MNKEEASSGITLATLVIGGVIYAITHNMTAALICAGMGMIIGLLIIFFKDE